MTIESLDWLLLDGNSDPIVAANPLPTALIRRASDNLIYDWSDGAFKSGGWGNKTATLTEVDGVNIPGLYNTNLVIDGFNGKYSVHANYVGLNKQHALIELNIVNGVTRENLPPDLTPVLNAIGSLNNFDASTEQVVSSNMRGTDSVNTAAEIAEAVMRYTR